jgi:hypothetical protein
MAEFWRVTHNVAACCCKLFVHSMWCGTQARPVHLQAYSHAWIARPRRSGKALQLKASHAVTLPPWRAPSTTPADLEDGPFMAEEYCKRVLISVAAKYATELARACKLAMAQRQRKDACQHGLA